MSINYSKEENSKPVTKETLVFFLKTAWKEKPSLFIFYIAELIAHIVPQMAEIILTKFIVDEIAAIIGGAPVEEHIGNAVLYAVTMVVISWLLPLTEKGMYQLIGIYGEWFNEYFTVERARHCMEMDFEHTEDPAALDAVNKAKEGMDWYSGGLTGVLGWFYQVIENAAALLGVSTIIIMTCPLLLPIQIIALIFISVLNDKNQKINIKTSLAMAKINRCFGYFMYNIVSYENGKDIRLYNSRYVMDEKAKEYIDDSMERWVDQARQEVKNSWLMDLINALRDGMSYFYIGYLALTKAITVGDFTMCVSSAGTLYWSLYNIINSLQQLRKSCVYAHRYIEFMKYPAAMTKGDKSVKNGEHIIEFSHVSFKYPRSEKFVLRDINITIKSGEHLSVVGLNGAGKSTFIKLLCRLYDVTEGAILIDGINIKEYSDKEYRKLFAVVFQDFSLFAFSLRENIALDQKADDSKIEEALKLSGFYEDAQKLPKGLDTMIYKGFDEDGTDLSGGQRQKTAIARALYKNAPIVILDEPTAALDPIAEYEIYRQFNSLVGGKTAIYISHRLSSCKFCDKIAVFSDDTIKEYGTHEELVDLPDGVYSEMFAAQAQYYVDNN